MARKSKLVAKPDWMSHIEHKKYLAQTRYEHWTREGKTWCNWFNIKEADTEAELKQIIKEYKKTSVNPRMKLKDDYRIIENPAYTENK